VCLLNGESNLFNPFSIRTTQGSPNRSEVQALVTGYPHHSHKSCAAEKDANDHFMRHTIRTGLVIKTE
jgi:hypothetical protein